MVYTSLTITLLKAFILNWHKIVSLNGFFLPYIPQFYMYCGIEFFIETISFICMGSALHYKAEIQKGVYPSLSEYCIH